MSETVNLKLPFIAPQQAQKHVTHNEALAALDRLVQLTVLDRDLAVPPASPVEGARYIVAAAPTGAWAGKARNIAVWSDALWQFHVPNEGWLVWVADEDVVLAYDGSQWIQLPAPAGATVFGINSTADTTNRLALSSPASLFNHAGNGHQMKLNKALATDTASILMQAGFSGRAELGLTGDDDFHVKVSVNGSTWKESVRLDRTTGRVSFPSGGVREQLTAARTYFVATTGLDSNTGLAAGTPFLTLQKAIDTVAGLDIGAFDVTVQLADGTYSTGVLVRGPFLGSGVVTIKGNTASPQNVILSRAAADAVTVRVGALRLEALTLQTSGASGSTIMAELGGLVVLGPGLRFGACINYHVLALTRAVVRIETGAAIAIVGGGASHLAAAGGQIDASGNTWTLTGTPVFTNFVLATSGGLVGLFNPVFSGAATGSRYFASINGMINTYTGNTALLPGSTAGAVATGGVYG
jgi:Protein of unknown function (DUF2793)